MPHALLDAARASGRPVLLLLDRPDLLDGHSRQDLESFLASATSMRAVVTGGPQREAPLLTLGRALERVALQPLSSAAIRQLLRQLAPDERALERMASWTQQRSGGLPAGIMSLWRALTHEARLQRTTPAALVNGSHADWTAGPTPSASATEKLRWRLDQSAVLIGRDAEFNWLSATLHAQRVVTLHGPAGFGKTRLALQAAWEERDASRDGVCFVDLVGVPRDRLPLTLAGALGVSGSDGELPERVVPRLLQARRSLLILDGLSAEYAEDPWLRALVETTSTTRWLITASALSNLPGEVTWRLGTLQDDADARALFLQAAQRAQSAFSPTPTDEATLQRIVRHLGASPLALEFAAAWLSVYPLTELAAALEDGRVGVDAALQHFWAQLSPGEARRVAALALLADGFDAHTARAVSGVSALLLSALLDRAFVRSRGDGTFTLPGVWRESALARLSAAERGAVIDRLERHAAERLSASTTGGSHDAVTRLYPWLRSTIEQLAAAQCDAVGLAVGLRHYWRRTGQLADGVTLLRLTLRGAPGGPHHLSAQCALGHLLQHLGEHEDAAHVLEDAVATARARRSPGHEVDALLGLARVRHRQSRYTQARELYAQAERLARHAQLAAPAALARGGMARADIYTGQLERAERDAQRALALLDTLDDQGGREILLNTLGLIALERRDFSAAQAYLGAALTLEEAQGGAPGVLLNLTGLAWLHLLRGDHDTSATLSERVLRELGESGGAWETANALVNLGHARVRQGQWRAAEQHFHESLELALASQSASVQLEALAGLAVVRCAAGRVVEAAELFTALLTQSAANAEFRQFYADFENELKARLGEGAFHAACAAGAARPWSDVLERATEPRA